MFRHFSRADIVDISWFVLGVVDALINAFLEFPLVELHFMHVDLHLLL